MYLISDGGINTNTLDTIESIMLTKNNKYDGVKIDVRESLDHVFVIARDEELEKFSYGKGKIREYNYSYLRKVKFPSHIFKYYIPTLIEILNNYNKNKIVVLEIYNLLDLDRLFILLVQYNYKYYFMSKNKDILSKLNELLFNQIGTIIDINNIIMNKNNTFFIKD